MPYFVATQSMVASTRFSTGVSAYRYASRFRLIPSAPHHHSARFGVQVSPVTRRPPRPLSERSAASQTCRRRLRCADRRGADRGLAHGLNNMRNGCPLFVAHSGRHSCSKRTTFLPRPSLCRPPGAGECARAAPSGTRGQRCCQPHGRQVLRPLRREVTAIIRPAAGPWWGRVARVRESITATSP